MSNRSDYSNLSEARTNGMCIHYGYCEWRDVNCRAGLSCDYAHNGRAKGIRNGKRRRENSLEHQQGNKVINYLHRRPCYRENLGALADLCLPSLLAHQAVQSGQSNLGDPAGRKQKGHFVHTVLKAVPWMCNKGKMVTAFFHRTRKGCCDEWTFIKTPIFRYYKWNVSSKIQQSNTSQHEDDKFEMGKL